jgi:D-3-phosphoglycerate dehydrogenase
LEESSEKEGAMSKLFKVFVPELFPPALNQKEMLEEIAEVKIGHGRVYSEEELVDEIKDIDGILMTSKIKLTKNVMDAGRRLKVVSKYGVGVDTIDVEYATQKGILVCFTPGVNSDAVAEHTLGLVLTVLRKIPQSMTSLRKGGWREEKFLGEELTGATVGIIGFGNIGLRLAKKLAGFEVRLLVYDPYVSVERIEKAGGEKTDLTDLLRQSGIVSLNLAFTSETFHFIGKNELRQMKSTSYLINTARGPLIDEKALYHALKEGWIAGAGLDVFEEEPAKMDNPLFSLDNVVVTPHLGGSTHRARHRLVIMAVENLLRALKGGLPERENMINPEVLNI